MTISIFIYVTYQGPLAKRLLDIMIVFCFKILLSVISILNEPNCSSPANVDASIMYRKYRDASDKKKQQTAYAKIILEQVNLKTLTVCRKLVGPQIATSC